MDQLLLSKAGAGDESGLSKEQLLGLGDEAAGDDYGLMTARLLEGADAFSGANASEVTHEQLLQDADKDVGDEKVAASLEDPGLVERMRYARNLVASEEEKWKATSSAEAMAGLISAMGRLSQITGEYRKDFTEFDQHATGVGIMARHLECAARGNMLFPHFSSIAFPSRVMRGEARADDDPQEVAAEAAKFVGALAAAAVKPLAVSGDFLALKVAELQKLNGRLSALHTIFTSAVETATQALRVKDDQIMKQRELLEASAALYDYDKVTAEKKRREILGFLRAAPAPTSSMPPTSSMSPAQKLPTPSRMPATVYEEV